ncbi:hypothetical protein D3C81_15890 [compost metagenome]
MLKNLHELDKWLGRSTWPSSHPIDTGVFYDAVTKIFNANNGLLHEAEISAYIKSKKEGEIAPDRLDKFATEYAQKAELISDYLLSIK